MAFSSWGRSFPPLPDAFFAEDGIIALLLAQRSDLPVEVLVRRGHPRSDQ
jgi:hypothetical protein